MTVRALLQRYRGARVHVLPNPGNAGDGLIHGGLRRLCDQYDLSACELRYPEAASGDILLASGAGNLCAPYSGAAERIGFYASRFDTVVVLPSSVDVASEPVRRFLGALPPATDVFCRERYSVAHVAEFVPREHVHVDHDLAFEADLAPWSGVRGMGILYAFRSDAESAGGPAPPGNFDISSITGEWMTDLFLDVVSAFEVVHTDRAHVAIAAAMLGRETHVYATRYHKVRGIYELSLAAMPHVRFHAHRDALPPVGRDGDPRFAIWRARGGRGRAVRPRPGGLRVRRPAALAGLARVKNEADIIEQFVRHHAGLLDHLVVVDNASCDGTREILGALEAEGLPLTVLDDDLFAYRQCELMTYLVRAMFAELGAARIALLDADEFITVANRAALDAALARVPAETHALAPWRTYVPERAGAVDDGDPLGTIVRRRERERVHEAKLFVSASLLRDPAATIVQGNHDVTGGPGITRAELDGVVLAHFPVRGVAQLTVKALVGWNAYVAMGYGDEGYGYQWRRAYETIVAQGGLDAGTMLRIAAGYPGEPADAGSIPLIADPLPAPPVRYGALRVRDPAVVVAGALNLLARQTAATAARARTVLPALAGRAAAAGV